MNHVTEIQRNRDTEKPKEITDFNWIAWVWFWGEGVLSQKAGLHFEKPHKAFSHGGSWVKVRISPPGNICETSGNNLGIIREASGNHQGNTCESPFEPGGTGF